MTDSPAANATDNRAAKSRGQKLVLEVLRHIGSDPSAPDLWNAHEIAEDLERHDPGLFHKNWTYDRVHSILKNLERRGLVKRLRNPRVADDWRLTDA